MNCKIKRIASVLSLVVALVSVVFLPKSGSCETLRFVFLADSRGDNETAPINTPVLNAIIAKIQTLHDPPPAFVVFGGDMAYRGVIHDRDILQEWKELFTDAGLTLYAVIGNHELYHTPQENSFLENQQEFQKVFTDNPTNGPPGYERLAILSLSPGGDAFFAALDPYYLTGMTTPPRTWVVTLLLPN